MKKYILEYDFLGVHCELEYSSLDDFAKKLDNIMEMPEILLHTVVIRTEEK